MHPLILTMFSLLVLVPASLAETSYVAFTAQPGDAIISVLRRYRLLEDKANYERFCVLNKLEQNSFLILQKTYLLPIERHDYNGRSIRSTLGKNDWALAKRIEAYNDSVHAAGLKNDDYRMDCELWIPGHIYKTEAPTRPVLPTKPLPAAVQVVKEPLLGPAHESIEVVDTSLAGRVYYLVAGHGGPDPGAQGHCGSHCLCEDEYAYDITLRLARNLMSKGATVHIMTKDLNDGIREGEYLECDEDEVNWSGSAMALNQKKRLQQRVGEVNALYKEHKAKGVTHQRLLMIHIDSRSEGQRADMFFYHHPGSKNGKALVSNLHDTIEEKYAQHQKGRGYTGKVSSRDLFMLRESLPVAGYIELGNLKNHLDQKRLVVESNRQAVANWLTAGLVKECP